MAKVLGIAGSPRRGGNSDLLLDSFLAGSGAAGHDAEKIYVYDLRIAPCDEGNSCHKTGECRIKDDMQDIYRKLLEADCLIISTPVFFMGLPSQLKAMIDRCQSLWAKRFVLKKPLRDDDKKRYGYFLAVSGLNKKEAFTGAKETIKAFFYVLGFTYKGELLFEGVDRRGDIRSREGALEQAYEMGKETQGLG